MNSRSHSDLKRLTTIVFDVDGTLYEQSGLRRAMFLRLLRHVVTHPGEGVAVFRALRAYRHAQELLRGAAIDGTLAEAQIRLACERSGQPSHALVAIVDRWMEREPLDMLERFVMPGLRPLLAAAKVRGLRLGVLSDYPATAKLEAMKLSEFFDVVVSAQDPSVNRFKPDPSGLTEALRRLGAAPSQALYVGDRFDVDASVAGAAGVACIIVGKRRSPGATKDGDKRPDVSGSLGGLPHRASAGIANYTDLHTMLFPADSEQTS
jgi:HAD superfamily hydrolase (TIGR01509 family)